MSDNSKVDISCFDDIIGLSQTTCPCYPDNTYDNSLSDLYLDELTGMNLKMFEANCENGNIWDQLNMARQNAIKEFIGDANSGILKKNTLRRQPFYGTLGRPLFHYDRKLNHTYAGVRWYCADIVSGEVEIKKIGTLFSQTGTITLYIYNSLNELLHTIPLNTTANVHNLQTLSTPITLPLHNSYAERIEYFFVYQVTSNLPKDNDIKCNCGSFKPSFDCRRPYFSQTNAQFGWASYFMCGSWGGNTLTDFDDCSLTTDNYMNGLTFELETRCNVNETICKDRLDFKSNPLAISMALAIRYKAGQLLLEGFLASDRVDRFTLLNGENSARLAQLYSDKYTELITFIVSKINITSTDCFVCDDIIKMTKTGIFA